MKNIERFGVVSDIQSNATEIISALKFEAEQRAESEAIGMIFDALDIGAGAFMARLADALRDRGYPEDACRLVDGLEGQLLEFDRSKAETGAIAD